jgi:AcrR family transcriptional regulator
LSDKGREHRQGMSRQDGRDLLIEQASKLFRAKGYSATSIDDVTSACGITKGSLYYHFDSKEALALAAMDRVRALYTEKIFSLIAASDQPGPEELSAFNQAVERFFTEHPDGCLLANLSLEIGVSSEPFRQRIKAYFEEWRACYAKVFARYFPPARVEALAEDAVAAVQGCILMRRIDGNAEPLRRQHRKLVALIS